MENEELIQRYKETKDNTYLETLFKQVENFIHYKCKNWFVTAETYRVEYEELVSVATMEFMNVVNNFDKDKDVKFVSIFGKYIDFKFNKLIFRQYKKHLNDVYLDEIVPESNKSRESVTTLLDLLPDDTIDIEENYILKKDTEQINDALSRAIASISESDLNLLEQYYFKHKTQKEIAEQRGVGQMSISRYLKRVTNELREKMITIQDLSTQK